jgi:hypothetical protein
MAINTSKVIVGGLAAGLVANVLGFLLFGLWLGPRFQADVAAAAPSLQGSGMSGGAIATNVVLQFVVGLLLAWLYAALRPRFGPGMKTAIYAALVVWICGVVFKADWVTVGLMTSTSFILGSVAALVQVIVAAYVAGVLYKE